MRMALEAGKQGRAFLSCDVARQTAKRLPVAVASECGAVRQGAIHRAYRSRLPLPLAQTVDVNGVLVEVVADPTAGGSKMKLRDNVAAQHGTKQEPRRL